MSENQNVPQNNFENYAQAEQYVDAVRELYRDRKGAFRGTRENETLQLIDEYAREAGSLIVDRAFLGTMGIAGTLGLPVEQEKSKEELQDDKTPRIAGFSWSDYREEFGNMMAGFAIITHRLNRDGFNVPSFTDLSPEDEITVAETLFYDFQKHNAYRFGVEGSNAHMISEVIEFYDDEWVKHKKSTGKLIDMDKARNLGEIAENMRKRGYRERSAQHAAMKTSPDQYPELRQTYPKVDKDDFDYVMSQYQNPIEALANREESSDPKRLG